LRKKNIFLLFLILVFSVSLFLFLPKKTSGVSYENSLYSDSDYVSMARYFEKVGERNDAIEHYKKALEINSDNLEANLVLAMYHHKRCEYDQALQHFQRAALLQPNSPTVFFNIGYIKYHQGKIAEAINYLEKAISLNPNDESPYKWLSFACLMLGQIDKGYEIEDLAYDIKLKNNTIDKQWDGSDLNGKTLLIHDNIGVGDIFCFIRYAKFFKQQGAKIIVSARKFIFPLLRQCSYIDECVERFKALYKYDYVVYMSRLPRIVHKALGRITGDIPYLYADPKLINYWKQKLSSDTNYKIGICWDANRYPHKKTGQLIKTKRSMPLHYFYPLRNMKGVSLYSLQQVNGMDQLDYAPGDFKVCVFDSNFDKKHGSFMDTAAVMKNLDLVITVDTSVAHLAGALGVPVWVVLPYVPDWRWLLGTSTTYLYPTMKFFRQKKLGSWESAMEGVYKELNEILST